MGRHGGYRATGKERERGTDAAAGQEKRLFGPRMGEFGQRIGSVLESNRAYIATMVRAAKRVSEEAQRTSVGIQLRLIELANLHADVRADVEIKMLADAICEESANVRFIPRHVVVDCVCERRRCSGER